MKSVKLQAAKRILEERKEKFHKEFLARAKRLYEKNKDMYERLKNA